MAMMLHSNQKPVLLYQSCISFQPFFWLLLKSADSRYPSYDQKL